MIKTNKHYSFKRYKYGWELHSHTVNEKEYKTGLGIVPVGHIKTETTFHSNLKQLAARVVDTHVTGCEEFEELLNTLNHAEEIIIERLENNERNRSRNKSTGEEASTED